MRAITQGRKLRRAFLPLALALAGTVAACGGDPQGSTGAWRYDEEATVKRAADGADKGATVKRKLAGMSGTLEFHRDNSYRMTITGGPGPTDQTGSFKSGNGQMVLNPKNKNGQAVNPTENEVILTARDPQHIEVPVMGFVAVFTPAPAPAPAPAPTK